MLDDFLNRVSHLIHVGANYGQERDIYAKHGISVFWVESIPEVFDALKRNLEEYQQQRAVCAPVTDTVGRKHLFHVSNNDGASSSILEFAQHKDIWPEVCFTRDIELISTTFRQTII
jgi:hypothetical protein